MKRQMVLIAGLLIFMYVVTQKSYAHEHHHHTFQSIQDTNIDTLRLAESNIDLSKVDPLTGSKSKNISASLVAMAVVNESPYYCTGCGCGFFSHMSQCSGGADCFLHPGLACNNGPYIP